MDKYNILESDFNRILQMDVDWSLLKGKKILITGATGLIGSMVCRTLSNISVKCGWDLDILAMVRHKEYGEKVLADVLHNENICFIEQDITEEIVLEDCVSYIIHTACPTKSQFFIEKPVETVQAIVNGTVNVLEFARKIHASSVLYLSSMEVYGQILHEELLTPENVGYINPLNLRSCYPEGKRMAENLCMGYFSEYEVPVKIVRLAQTFGPGILADDNRVFAQFIRSVQNNEDIVMFTEGGSKRMYLDTMDAVSAMLAILLKGESGHVYNAGNPATYCSIKEMAELVIREFGNGSSNLVIDRSKDVGQYPADNMLKLDISPLKKLGWKAQYSLTDMYERMIRTI